jgi:hypothetical protein
VALLCLCEVEYTTPLALLWYAIAVDDLSRQFRLDLLRIAFRIPVKWASSELLSQLQVLGIREEEEGWKRVGAEES